MIASVQIDLMIELFFRCKSMKLLNDLRYGEIIRSHGPSAPAVITVFEIDITANTKRNGPTNIVYSSITMR